MGGGALGLTAALRLAQRGADVTLIEKENELGGLAAGFKVGDSGAYLEKAYHHLFRSDKDIQALLKELGLDDKLEWHNTITATLFHGKTYNASPKDILFTYPIPISSRLRMAAVSAYLKFAPSYKQFRKHTADAWLTRMMGRQAYEMQFKPLLVGKFGDYHRQIALPWFWSRVHERSFDLGYLRGGFQQMYNKLGDEIRAQGGKIQLGTAVTRIVPAEGGKTRVEIDKGQPYTFDAIASTLPTKPFLRLAEGLPESYRNKYDWGVALGAHIVILSLKHSLMPPIYWLNLNDPGFPFLVAVEHTNMIPPAEYGGRHFIYLGNYLPMEHRYFKMPDEEVVAEFVPNLKKLNPRFSEDWVQEHWVFKLPFAQPVVTREYEAHIPPLETPLPNVYMGNMFQVYPQDRGQNYSIRLGNKLGNMIPIQGSRSIS